MYIDVSHIHTDTKINDKGSNKGMTKSLHVHVPHENLFRKNIITSNGRCTCTDLTAIRAGNRL